MVDDGTLVSLQSIVTSLGPQGVQTTEAVWTCGQRLAPGRQNMNTQKDHASIGRLAGCGLAGGLIGAMLPPMVGLGSNLFFREFLVLIIGAIALVAGPVLGIVVGMTIYGCQPIAGAANSNCGFHGVGGD